MDWVQKLIDDIEELLANDKSVKFNTHKNRKRISGTIGGLIKSAIHENGNKSTEGRQAPIRNNQDAITRPNPSGGRGFAIMTEGESTKNDDVHKAHTPGASFSKNAVSNHNAGMRKW